MWMPRRPTTERFLVRPFSINARDSGWLTGWFMCRIPGTGEIAALITAGYWEFLSIIRPALRRGRRALLAEEFGAIAASPATAQTCLLRRGIHLIPLAFGEVANRLHVCRQDRCGLGRQPITGPRRIG